MSGTGNHEEGGRPRQRLRARGAGFSPAPRFEPCRRVAVDDGWPADDEPPELLTTEIAREVPRRIITRNSSPDVSFDRSVNPYRGCEHGCIYCYARPSHAWLGLSPGLDFESRIISRPTAAEALRRELAAAGYRPEPIALGTNTDPYQPVEARERVTRALLEVLAETRHPVTITTRGTLIERDLDLLAPMARQGLVHVGVSVTTLDPALARAMEPRAPAPARRLAIIRRLSGAGVPVRVMVAPVIPALTDHELEAILEAARDAGARAGVWIMLRLPQEVGPLFEDWLRRHRPEAAARVMNRVRAMRAGRTNDPRFGARMRGEGEHARLLAARFRVACRRLGMEAKLLPLRRDLFRPPPRDARQLSLF